MLRDEPIGKKTRSRRIKKRQSPSEKPIESLKLNELNSVSGCSAAAQNKAGRSRKSQHVKVYSTTRLRLNQQLASGRKARRRFQAGDAELVKDLEAEVNNYSEQLCSIAILARKSLESIEETLPWLSLPKDLKKQLDDQEDISALKDERSNPSSELAARSDMTTVAGELHFKRDTAAHLKLEGGHRELEWQTDLISESSSVGDDLSPPNYENIFELSSDSVSGSRLEKRSSADSSESSRRTRNREEANLEEKSSRFHQAGDRKLASRDEGESKQNFFTYNTQTSGQSSGKPSTSYSEVFDSHSGYSQSRLTRPSSSVNSQSRKLDLSMENLGLLIKQNLVATLVLVYILVSLMVIVVLIVPYASNMTDQSQLHDGLRFSSYAGSDQKAPQQVQINNYQLSSTSAMINKINQDINNTSIDQLRSNDETGAKSRQMSETSQPKAKEIKSADQMEDSSAEPTPVAESIVISQTQVGDSNRRRESRPPISDAKQEVKVDNNSTIGSQSAPTMSRFRDLWNETFQQECQLLKVPFCSRSIQNMFDTGEQGKSAAGQVAADNWQLPSYDKTLLPNQFTRLKQWQIERALQKFEPIIDIKCYALMPLFLCTIYAPKCIQIPPPSRSASLGLTIGLNNNNNTSGDRLKAANQTRAAGEHWARLVPPCRSLCREAFRKCMFFFEVLSLSSLEPSECNFLPESSDSNICVGLYEHNLMSKLAESQKCQDDKYRCNDGQCILKKYRCDGYADCTDKSDEQKCSRCNSVSQFYCGQDVCIDKELVCNGIRDCRDGRDERQCLRLNDATIQSEQGVFERRRLEVWNALNDSWLPVCGAHWSAMPMSHEACQALGYSRANETLILLSHPKFGRDIHSNATALTGEQQRISKQSSSLVADSSRVALKGGDNPSRRSTSNQAGAWFDVQSGDSSVTGSEFASQADNEQMAGIVEEIAVVESSAGSNGLDHIVRYERQIDPPPSGAGLGSSGLVSVESKEAKLRSLTSLLYHGPQRGCIDRPGQLTSSVYLQCQNFQCGRSITSYSSRLRSTRLRHSIHGQSVKSFKAEANFRSALLDQHQPDNQQREEKLEANEELGLNDQDYTEYGVADDDIDELSTSKSSEENSSAATPLMLDQYDLSRENSSQSNAFRSEQSLISPRLVVGGIESMPGEFPYLAALHGGPDEVFFCGGVLISINWLLTAAHCVGNRTQPDGWMVKVGVTRRIASPAFVRKLKVRRIIKHPEFNHGSVFNNDIALILLEESVQFNQYLRPICLPRANLKLEPENSKDCVVVGFGKSKFSQEANYLHVAHFVNVPIVHHSVCSNWYAEHRVNLTEGMLCAGYAEGKRDACQGDSGSGLFCRYPDTNSFYVAGVVSFGIKCATPKLPGVYTSVPSYVDWIEATTRQHEYPLS